MHTNKIQPMSNKYFVLKYLKKIWQIKTVLIIFYKIVLFILKKKTIFNCALYSCFNRNNNYAVYIGL